MPTLITILFIIFLGIFPPDGTPGYNAQDADLAAATEIACTIGTLHPDTACK